MKSGMLNVLGDTHVALNSEPQRGRRVFADNHCSLHVQTAKPLPQKVFPVAASLPFSLPR